MLEERALPSTSTWTGLGADNYWTDPFNWQKNIAPTAGSDLIFPAAVSQLSSVNNFAANTSFSSITFTGRGFTLGGNALTLGGGIIVNPSGVAGADIIAAGLTVAGNQSITTSSNAGAELVVSGPLFLSVGTTLSIAGIGTTDIQGQISGAGSLLMRGPGSLFLDNGQNNFTGGTEISGGVLAVTASGALGSSGFIQGPNGPTGLGGTGGTTVDAGGTLLWDDVAYNDLSETVFLDGGTMLAAGESTFAGPIVLDSDSAITTEDSSDLTLSGTISTAPNTVAVATIGGVGNTDISGAIRGQVVLTMSGAGTLELDSTTSNFTGGTMIDNGAVVVTGSGALGDAGATTTVNVNTALIFANVNYQAGSSVNMNGGIVASTGRSTFNGSVTLQVATVIQPQTGSTFDLTGVIGGQGGLIFSGPGILRLDNTNTFTGGTNIDASTLVVTADGALGPGGIQDQGTTVAAGATLQFAGVNYQTPEAITLNGTLSATSDNVFNGTLTLPAVAGAIVPAAGSTLDITGVINGAGSVGMNGPGTLELDNQNRYIGGTVVKQGLLLVTVDGALGAANGTTTVDVNAAIEFEDVVYSTPEAIVLNNDATPGSAPELIGASNLNGQSGFGGPISGTNGFFDIFAETNSTLILSGQITSVGSVMFDGPGAIDVQGTITPADCVVTKQGTGVLRLDNPGNSFANGLFINNGTVIATANGVLGSGAISVSPGATLELDHVNYSSPVELDLDGGTLSGRSSILGQSVFAGPVDVEAVSIITAASNSDLVLTGAINLESAGLTASGPGTTDFQGIVSGGAANNVTLVEDGPGSLELDANNTYVGGTSIVGGTLIVNGAQPQSPIAVGLGTLAGTGTAGAINSFVAGSVSPGRLFGTGILRAHGDVNLLGGNIAPSLSFQLDGTTAGTSYDQLDVIGNVSLGGSTLNLSLGYTPQPGDTYTLIAPTGTLQGTFSDAQGNPLPEGSLVFATGPSGASFPFVISYHGGFFGNQVVLTRVIVATWTGLGVTNNWSEGANWAAGIAPSAGSFLIFPNVPRPGANDDLPVGMSFAGIQFQTPGFGITGNSITLTGAITSQAPGFESPDSIVNPITMANEPYLAIEGSGSILLGPIQGPGGLLVESSSPVTLLDVNSYAGPTQISSGILNVENSQGLSQTVTVAAGATLQLQGNLSIPSTTHLFLAGTGFAGEGALDIRNSNVIWAGTIAPNLASQAGAVADNLNISVDFESQLTVTGSITEAAVPGTTTTSTLVKLGTGTLILTGANSYLGNTNITAGILNVQNSQALGAQNPGFNQVTVANRATLQIQGNISLPAFLTLLLGGNNPTNEGVVDSLSGSNIWAGTIAPNVAAQAGAVANNLAIGVEAGSKLSITGTIIETTVAGTTTTSTLLKSGTGILAASGFDTYLGGTDLENGELDVGSAGALGLNTVTVDFGSLVVPAGVAWFPNAVVINANGTFNVLGSAELFGTLTDAGTVTVGASSPGVSGSTLKIDAGATVTGTMSIQNASVLVRSANASGTFTDSSSVDVRSQGILDVSRTFIELNPGTLTVESGGTFLIEAFSNVSLGSAGITGAGTVTVLGGTITAGAPNSPSVAIANPINLSGQPTLTVNATSLSLNGPVTLTNNATVTVSQGLAIFTGVIGGAFGLTTAGPGTLELTGNNTYNGLTNILSGTLAILGTQSQSAVNVQAGATLMGTGTIGALTDNGTVIPGSLTTGTGTLQAASANFNSGSILQINVVTITTGIRALGVLQLAGQLAIAFQFAGPPVISPVLNISLTGTPLVHSTPATFTPVIYKSLSTVSSFNQAKVLAPNPSGYSVTSTTTGATSVSVTVKDPPPVFLVSPTGMFQGQHAYTTIQAAINAAPGGAVIEVAPGTYKQNITINKAVVLQGAQFGQSAGIGRTNLAAESVVNGSITITSSNAVLDGFTVQNSVGAAIVISPLLTSDEVLHNVVQHSVSGLIVNGAIHADIADNRFNANTNQNILVQNHASNNTIEVNLIEGAAADGIDVVGSNNNNIAANTVTANSGDGIVLYVSTGNTLQNNIFTSNSSNVVLQSSNGNIVVGNTVEQSTGKAFVNRLGYKILVTPGWGIGLYASASNQIADNILEDNLH